MQDQCHDHATAFVLFCSVCLCCCLSRFSLTLDSFLHFSTSKPLPLTSLSLAPPPLFFFHKLMSLYGLLYSTRSMPWCDSLCSARSMPLSDMLYPARSMPLWDLLQKKINAVCYRSPLLYENSLAAKMLGCAGDMLGCTGEGAGEKYCQSETPLECSLKTPGMLRYRRVVNVNA